ncbi:hypothetical protein DERF_004899 [Dermatophagoides farinae]|uniref:Uncharacterized protein n=1 Tax=Dermatophagoides farinae TaxID=6954 RepID=A0A922I4M5_DERFA|nr:hypothetical protein DERF_004899 [Dermatophagoides farinae]
MFTRASDMFNRLANSRKDGCGDGVEADCGNGDCCCGCMVNTIRRTCRNILLPADTDDDG